MNRKTDMRRIVKGLVIIAMVLPIIGWFTSCGAEENSRGGSADVKGEYVRISQEEAKNIMDEDDDIVILDVRTPEEFAEGHIPGALLIPDYDIEKRAEAELTDKNQTVLVYCRSGNRSRGAAKKLISMGYTDVRDFGGIMSWPYETE